MTSPHDQDQVSPGPLGTQDILQRARAGDAGAFEALYRRYRPMLVVMVHARVPEATRNFDAEDVTQSAFLKAWDQIRNFEYRGEGSFRRWLTTLVLNKLRDNLRRNGAASRGGNHAPGQADLGGSLATVSDGQPGPFEIAERLEQHMLLIQKLGQLDEPDQEIISLKLFERCSWSRVAQILELGEGAARNRFQAALARLTALHGPGAAEP